MNRRMSVVDTFQLINTSDAVLLETLKKGELYEIVIYFKISINGTPLGCCCLLC